MKAKKVIPNGIYCIEIDFSIIHKGRKKEVEYRCPLYHPYKETEYPSFPIRREVYTGVCGIYNKNIESHVKICKCNYKLKDVELIDPELTPHDIYRDEDNLSRKNLERIEEFQKIRERHFKYLLRKEKH